MAILDICISLCVCVWMCIFEYAQYVHMYTVLFPAVSNSRCLGKVYKNTLATVQFLTINFLLFYESWFTIKGSCLMGHGYIFSCILLQFVLKILIPLSLMAIRCSTFYFYMESAIFCLCCASGTLIVVICPSSCPARNFLLPS